MLQPEDFASTPLSGATLSVETERRHMLQELATLRDMVVAMERKLGINVRWTSNCAEWKSSQVLLNTRTYRQALDNLEGLIVARLFELTKMNLSGTGNVNTFLPMSSGIAEQMLGYKLRMQISKALNARSQSIQRAIEKYNDAAQAFTPPRPVLEWKQVVEYAFLADFDLLRDTNRAILEKPWSRPTARNAMNTYFKICRAREEIIRLNVETRRLLTFMEDEERFLDTCAQQLMDTEPQIGFQVQRIQHRRHLVNLQHRTRLNSLSRITKFSGVMTIGQHKGPAP